MIIIDYVVYVIYGVSDPYIRTVNLSWKSLND